MNDVEGVKDLRDWDLLPDYGSFAQQTDLKTRTSMGPLTEVSPAVSSAVRLTDGIWHLQVTWLDKMRLMWILVNRTTKNPAINPGADVLVSTTLARGGSYCQLTRYGPAATGNSKLQRTRTSSKWRRTAGTGPHTDSVHCSLLKLSATFWHSFKDSASGHMSVPSVQSHPRWNSCLHSTLVSLMRSACTPLLLT